ncbi:interferon-induced, double-stranded RNA-activated protein kinase [Rhizophagus irregularis DAOM 181602=DAOM 197198]|nr:interferon-induced, double-stranded RNA-activated protein kinase [Rhizophagus irregularis DAOM 181602=DAOM 197198]
MSSTQPERKDTTKFTFKNGGKTYELWLALGEEKVNEVRLPGGKKFDGKYHAMSKLMSENFSNETYEKTFSQLQMLGKGSFGSVWSAMHKYDKNTYAIKKIIVSKVENIYMVFQEAQALAKLEHPNVVRYFSSWIQSCNSDWTDLTPVKLTIFIQMELCSTSLKRVLEKRDGQIDPLFNIKIFHGIMKGIEYVHEKKLVHRDLKTDNIFLQEINTEFIPKIGDFGLVKSEEPTHLEANTKENDIYCLGVVLKDLYFPRKSLDDLLIMVEQQGDFNNIIELIFKMTKMTGSDPPQATKILESDIFNMLSDNHSGALTSKINSLEEKIKSLEQENADLKQENNVKKEKIKSLEQKIESMDGKAD